MANWTIQCADRYLAILYDYLHERLYDYHVLQADETPVLVNKEWKGCREQELHVGLPHRRNVWGLPDHPV